MNIMEGGLRLPQQGLNPAMNNMPLMFNPNKGKPLVTEDRKEEIPTSTTSQDNSASSMVGSSMTQGMSGGGMQGSTMTGGTMTSGAMTSGMMPMGSMGYPSLGYPSPMMGHDPNMMMMGQMGQMGQMMGQMGQYGGYMGPVGPGIDPSLPIQRDIINLKSCSLYPPPPGTPPRTHRERPPGCRTIFIGGLPDTATEEILTEVFDSCGPIISVRLSKKNFAHIRFQMMDSADRALFISGYRMKIENKDDKPNTGRIHVDYAVARDDQYEFECQQRALAREMRHRMSIEEARLRGPSPPPVTHFNDHEASVVLDQLKSDENFIKASITLVTWLERGDCVRRTSNMFFSMIQASNSHVRCLLNEKQQFEEDLRRAKLTFRQQIECILKQFDQIDKIFAAASKQRCWDHFSKAQRKSIELWNKQAKEIHMNQQEEFLNEREEDEMDLSDQEDTEVEGDKAELADKVDAEGAPVKRKRLDSGSGSDVQSLRDENDSLKCQLEGYKNEIDIIKQDSQTQVKALQNSLQALQQQLLTAQKHIASQKPVPPSKDSKITITEDDRIENKKEDSKEAEDEADVITIKDDEEHPIVEEVNDTTSVVPLSQSFSKEMAVEIIPVFKVSTDVGESTVTSSGINLNPKEAKLLGLICCFLHVHPFGATVDYLWSYLNQLEIVKPREVEDLLERFPMLFKQNVHGVGASIERRWNFCGYTNLTG